MQHNDTRERSTRSPGGCTSESTVGLRGGLVLRWLVPLCCTAFLICYSISQICKGCPKFECSSLSRVRLVLCSLALLYRTAPIRESCVQIWEIPNKFGRSCSKLGVQYNTTVQREPSTRPPRRPTVDGDSLTHAHSLRGDLVLRSLVPLCCTALQYLLQVSQIC